MNSHKRKICIQPRHLPGRNSTNIDSSILQAVGRVSLQDMSNRARNVRVGVALRRVRFTIFAVDNKKVSDVISACLWPELSSTHCACAVLYCHQ